MDLGLDLGVLMLLALMLLALMLLAFMLLALIVAHLRQFLKIFLRMRPNLHHRPRPNKARNLLPSLPVQL